MTYSSNTSLRLVSSGFLLPRRHLLFNVFLCDLFLFASNSNMENYADYNMPYLTNKHLRRFARCYYLHNTPPWVFFLHCINGTKLRRASHLEIVLKIREQETDILLKLFTDNLIKANPEKYHLLVSINEEQHLNVGGIEISNSQCKELLGIRTDCKLVFVILNLYAKKQVKNWMRFQGLH